MVPVKSPINLDHSVFFSIVFLFAFLLSYLIPETLPHMLQKIRHLLVTLAPLLHLLPGENSGKCPQKSQLMYGSVISHVLPFHVLKNTFFS